MPQTGLSMTNAAMYAPQSCPAATFYAILHRLFPPPKRYHDALVDSEREPKGLVQHGPASFA